MTICACGGNSKLIIDEYVINTRIPEYRQIVLKNVRFRQCKICGQTELTEGSQKMVNLLRDHYVKKYYDDLKKQENAKPSMVKDLIKLFHL